MRDERPGSDRRTEPAEHQGTETKLARPPADGSQPSTSTLALASGRSIEVAQEDGEERVRIRSPEGALLITVRLTNEGPVLCLSGVSLEIAATKSLSLRAETLRFEAKRDAEIDVGGCLHERVGAGHVREIGGAERVTAREVTMATSPGGIVMRANDDVSITGERVRLNSDDPPMPLTWEEHRARQARKLASAKERPIELALPDPGSSRPPEQ